MHGNTLDDAGVVHEDIDLTDLSMELFDQCLHIVFFGNAPPQPAGRKAA